MMQRCNHYQLDSKLSSKDSKNYYTHPLSSEIEKRCQEYISNDNISISLSFMNILTDWLVNHYKKRLSRLSK